MAAIAKNGTDRHFPNGPPAGSPGPSAAAGVAANCGEVELAPDVAEFLARHDRSADAARFRSGVLERLPPAMWFTPVAAECLHDLADQFPPGVSPPDYEYDATVNKVFLGRFRMQTLGRICFKMATGRRGIDPQALRDDCFGSLALLQPHQFFKPERCVDFRSWLKWTVVRPALTNELRAMGARRKQASERLTGDEADPRVTIDPEEVREKHDRVLAAMQSLSRDDRLLLRLRFFEGMTLDGLAETFGVGYEALAQRLSRAARRLRGLLEREVSRE